MSNDQEFRDAFIQLRRDDEQWRTFAMRRESEREIQRLIALTRSRVADENTAPQDLSRERR